MNKIVNSDESEFMEIAGTEAEEKASKPGHDDDDDAYNISDIISSVKAERKDSKLGQPTQYSQYGPGFKPTTDTIPSLKSGVYDIDYDDNGVFVTPTLPPSGLLLELPEMRSEAVISVIQQFWDSEKDYKEGNEFVKGGAQYKAGIMLYGPPGSGKTSTIKIVCKKLIERDGVVFHCSRNPSLALNFLTSFARIEKDRKCIVIFEDIDSLIDVYGESGYLEILDSAKSIDNVMFIATTNYPEKLDPRIYNRPGRFSHVIKIGLPTKDARRAFLQAVLKDHRDVELIVRESDGFTVDHLASLINGVYREKKELSGELQRLRNLFKIPKSGNEKSIGFSSSED